MSRWGARLGTLALTCTSAAQAQPSATVEPYRLNWVRERGAESCISGAALARLLEQVVGQSADASGARLVLEGEVAPAPPPLRWRVRVRVSDSHGELVGERELTHTEARCSALTSSVLLILAMSIDPEAARDGLPPAVLEELRRDRSEDVDVWPVPATGENKTLEPRAPLASAQSPRVATPPSPEPSGPSRSFTTAEQRAAPSTSFWQLFGGAALSTALLPKLSPGALLGARWVLPSSWSFVAKGGAWFPREAAVSGPRARTDGVLFGATQLASEVCLAVFGDSALNVDACGGGALGFRWVVASALGVENNPVRAYFGPLLSLEASLRTGDGWFLRGGATALASVMIDRFTYRDHNGETQPLYTPSVVSGYAFLGLGARL
jgi:hypothetical protein